VLVTTCKSLRQTPNYYKSGCSSLSFRILFDRNGKQKTATEIQSKLNSYSSAYDNVVRIIIKNSVTLDEGIFRFNVATLMPTFSMTRIGVFHGMRIENKTPIDSDCRVLDECWKRFADDFKEVKKAVSSIPIRNRALFELPEPSSDIIAKISDLFDEIKWTTLMGSRVGRVGASKMLFAIFPEIALPIDNTEWDYVFMTDSYRKVLLRMIEEIIQWEKASKIDLETMSKNDYETLPSIYNVMAMSERPKKNPR
jgi:hypothetical protein